LIVWLNHALKTVKEKGLVVLMEYVYVKKGIKDLCVNTKHVLITAMEMEFVIMVNAFANQDLKV
jgi:hypothetical protein